MEEKLTFKQQVLQFISTCIALIWYIVAPLLLMPCLQPYCRSEKEAYIFSVVIALLVIFLWIGVISAASVLHVFIKFRTKLKKGN